MRNAIYAVHGISEQWPIRPGSGWKTWSSGPSALAVYAADSRVCAVHEDKRLVVAFKGFLHGADIDRSVRHDAAKAATLVAERWASGRGVSELWGRYQIYILEKSSGDLYVLTDPYGSAEVFVRSHEGGGGPPETVSIASSLATLAEFDPEPLRLDRTLEDFLLVYGFVPRPQTLFHRVERLGAATSLSLRSGSRHDWRIPFSSVWEEPDWTGASEEDVIEALRSGFFRSLDELAPDDEEVAVLLGGFDSALVAAGLAQRGHRVHTYTFRYSDERYNQKLTSEVAEATGAVHHHYDLNGQEVAEAIARYHLDANAPTNWPAYVVQTRLVADQIRRDGYSVCFSGDGCDNLFFGYPLTFRRGQVVEQLSRLPKPLLKVSASILAAGPVLGMLGRPAVVGAGVLESAQLENPARGYLTFRIFDPHSLSRLRNGQDPQAVPHAQLACDLAEPFRGKNPVQLSYLGKKCLTPSALKITSSLDASGVSILSPYQHSGMVALAAATPTELLRPEGKAGSAIGKYALTTMAERAGLLPPEVIHQPKMAAADVPASDWYSGVFRPVLEGLLENLPFTADAAMVDQMFSESLGEKLYMRLIGSETSGVVNLHHDISLLSTYGAMAALANGRPRDD